MPTIESADGWIKRDAEKERRRREGVRAMTEAALPFLDALQRQLSNDVAEFINEFPEMKDRVTVDRDQLFPYRNAILILRKVGSESTRVHVWIDNENWRLKLESRDLMNLNPQWEVKPNDGKVTMGRGVEIGSLSLAILRPVLFPELVAGEGQHGPARDY